jgi:hypothetical protein
VPAERPGAVIGRYTLGKLIGEGGFGCVHRAEQREPVNRIVALKIIKLGMDTNQVIARFEAERQALAMMEHPSIARVLDAGATETGRPYFVMELVEAERGVVVRAADARLGPGVNAYASAFGGPLSEGVEVEVLERREGWTKIRPVDGRIAWVKADSLEIV